MAGIVGVAAPNQQELVDTMLEKIQHRGAHQVTISFNNSTMGLLTNSDSNIQSSVINQHIVLTTGRGHYISVKDLDGHLYFERDFPGALPLYTGYDDQNRLVFSSEIKSLLSIGAKNIAEYLPRTENPKFDQPKFGAANFTTEQATYLASLLRSVLAEAVSTRVSLSSEFGSLLSGGLDSSAISAIARPHTNELHTFAAGVEGAPDLKYAKIVADHILSTHHEKILKLDELLKLLPEVIFHLESFDALLVRSSIMHFAASQMAGDFVPYIFSGEGGDELFAGYEYLKDIPHDRLRSELLDITGRLHNTALQRVDRCTLAHGVTPWVPILDPKVIAMAFNIPENYKLYNGVEKWIFRKSVEDLLPADVVLRPKSKFWQGSGVGEQLSDYFDTHITTSDFEKEKRLPNGWLLNSKEELHYYRLFRERLGDTEDLTWMGRTKGVLPSSYSN